MLTKHKRHPCGFGQSLWPTNFFSNLLTVTLAFTISSLIFMPQGVYTRFKEGHCTLFFCHSHSHSHSHNDIGNVYLLFLSKATG